MPLYTPHGLKLRFSLGYVFCLLERLYPRASAFQVLRTAEAIDNYGSTISFLVALGLAFSGQSFREIFFAAIAARIFAFFIVLTTRVIHPPFSWLLKLSALYTDISSGPLLFVLWLLLLLIGWATGSLIGILAALAALLVGFLVGGFFTEDIFFTGPYYRKSGIPYTRSEFDFWLAYQYHAKWNGMPLTVGIGGPIDTNYKGFEESMSFKEFAVDWPQLLARISDTDGWCRFSHDSGLEDVPCKYPFYDPEELI